MIPNESSLSDRLIKNVPTTWFITELTGRLIQETLFTTNQALTKAFYTDKTQHFSQDNMNWFTYYLFMGGGEGDKEDSFYLCKNASNFQT